MNLGRDIRLCNFLHAVLISSQISHNLHNLSLHIPILIHRQILHEHITHSSLHQHLSLGLCRRERQHKRQRLIRSGAVRRDDLRHGVQAPVLQHSGQFPEFRERQQRRDARPEPPEEVGGRGGELPVDGALADDGSPPVLHDLLGADPGPVGADVAEKNGGFGLGAVEPSANAGRTCESVIEK